MAPFKASALILTSVVYGSLEMVGTLGFVSPKTSIAVRESCALGGACLGDLPGEARRQGRGGVMRGRRLGADDVSMRLGVRARPPSCSFLVDKTLASFTSHTWA